MNNQLANVIADVVGETGQKILRAIVAGERDGLVLGRAGAGRNEKRPPKRAPGACEACAVGGRISGPGGPPPQELRLRCSPPPRPPPLAGRLAVRRALCRRCRAAAAR